MKIESKKIPQKQEVQGGKIFSKEAYSDVSDWEINFSNDEIRSFSGFFIDIFADIIDNYGDMWWVLEFLMMSGLPVSFRIVTDDTSTMREFLQRSECALPEYELLEKNKYKYDEISDLIILGLHAKVDLERFPSGTSIIRVSYLSYDPWYRGSHEREHMLSTPERPIIELTYSPLSGTGWVWHYEKSTTTRLEWLEKMWLPTTLEGKIWIPIFVYRETLEKLSLVERSEDIVIFFIGNQSISYLLSPISYNFSWLSRDDFWDLIDLADISVLRGEISSLRGLMSSGPYLWDMYKWKGGWNREDSQGFLDFIHADETYREIHDKINTRKDWSVEDILRVRRHWHTVSVDEIPDFRKTLEKTLDKLGISL